MTVTKINGFTAPYRSSTFQGQANSIAQASGLLRMDGSLENESGNVVVPPFSAIQNGLIIVSDSEKLVTDPGKTAPYYLAVSAATTHPVDDLSFQFPESPSDISSNQVLLGYWDGNEWRKPQMLSTSEINKDINQANLDFEREGPLSGLLTTYTSPNYTNTPGKIVDRAGLRQTLTESAVFTEVVEDADFNRVDRIIYRRPEDSENRIGLRKFILGGTHSTSIDLIKETEYLDSSFVNSSVKVLIGADNSAHILTARGYGDSFSVVYTKYAANRTTVLVPTIEVVGEADSGKFSACIDKDNKIHLFYIVDSNLYYTKLSSSGTILIASTLVHNHGYGIISHISSAYSDTLNAIFVVTQLDLSLTDSKLWFQSLANSDLSLSIRREPFQLDFVPGILKNPDIVISDDEEVYVAAEETATKRIWLRKYDDIGSPLATSINISESTDYLGMGILSGDAKLPKVRVADNRQIFVTFLQNKSSEYGMAIWSNGSSYMQDWFSPTENFTDYDVILDSFMNGLHFMLNDGSSVQYLKIEGKEVQFSEVLVSSTVSGLSTVRDVCGSMLHVYTSPSPGTYTTYETSKTLPFAGSQTVVGLEDTVYLGSSQFLVPVSGFSPSIGDKVVITTAVDPLNIIQGVISSKEKVSLNVSNDMWQVTLNVSFNSPETILTADFQSPNGNGAKFVKTNSELTSKAYRFDVLATDVLLCRISLPGPMILNYSGPGIGPSPAPTDRLLAFGDEVKLDWSLANPGSLTITGNLGIHDLVNNFIYTLNDGIFPLGEGDALYVKLDLTSSTPTPQVAPVATLDWAQDIKVLGVIEGGEFLPHFLLSSLGIEELEPGEVVFTGHDLPDMIRYRLGIISDTQYQAYDNTYIILAEDNYPTAISKLDASIHAIREDKNSEESYIVPAGGLPLVAGYPTFTSSSVLWDFDNESLDILVSVNGKKQTQDQTGTHQKDFQKYDVNKLQFTYQLPENAEITVFKVRMGGGAPGYLIVEDEDVQVSPVCQRLNFVGSGVTCSNGSGGQVNVMIPGGPAYSLLTVKVYRNASGGPLPAGTPVAFDTLGNIVKADANVITLSDFAGVVLNAIPDGAYGEVGKVGDIPGVLAGAGAIPGDLVYLGETEGTLSLTPPGGLSDTILVVGRAEPEAGMLPDGTASALFLNPQVISAGV